MPKIKEIDKYCCNFIYIIGILTLFIFAIILFMSLTKIILISREWQFNMVFYIIGYAVGGTKINANDKD
jgi:hypothetical protein